MMPYFFVSFSYAKTYPLRISVEIRTPILEKYWMLKLNIC